MRVQQHPDDLRILVLAGCNVRGRLTPDVAYRKISPAATNTATTAGLSLTPTEATDE